MAVSHVEATPPRYRMTPIREIGFEPTPFVSGGGGGSNTNGTMGINNKGQLTYSFFDQYNNFNVFVWLPESEYGFNAELTNVSTTADPVKYGFARDINIDGIIVGSSADYATSWTLTGGDVDVDTLHEDSWAYAINDQNPAIIVGGHMVFDSCAGGDIMKGFAWEYGDGYTTLAPAGNNTPGTDPNKRAIAIDIGPDSNTHIVGVGHPCEAFGLCHQHLGGQKWTSTANLLSAGSIKSGGCDADAFPYGINDDGEIAGWVRYNPVSNCTTLDCFDTAALWLSGSQVDLGLYMPVDQEGDESRAFSINLSTQVVGTNTIENRALIWQYYISSWLGEDLNDLIHNCNGEWTLREAHDINDDGWVVVYAKRLVEGDPPTIEDWMVLLTPFEGCPADVDGDGCITMDDFDEVLNRYYACPSISGCDCDFAEYCLWDVNGDCIVDASDAAYVYNSLCPEPGPSVPVCCDGCPSSLMEDEHDSWLEQAIIHVLLSELSNEKKQHVIETLMELE